MTNFLEAIHKRKKLEILKLKGQYSLEAGKMDTRFRNALLSKGIIAEIKRRSPSKGDLSRIPHPDQLALEYQQGGAIAISCLTDADFGASIEDLKKVTAATTLPVLRKDFIIDPLQIAEAKAHGASAVLLIVKLVKEQLKELLLAATKIGVEALVEVHNQDELDAALDAGADIIGINNRDLSTFIVDPKTSFTLFQKIPAAVHVVIESGISESRTARFFLDHGASACLVGETLVKSNNKAKFFRDVAAPLVKICGISSRDVARLSGESGADFVGIICDENSTRYVSPQAVKNIAKGAKEGGADPVCVFTEHSYEAMRSICLESGVSVVQLHGERSRAEHQKLPEDFIRFFVQPVEKDGSYTPIKFVGLNPKRDYILYDFKSPGSGTSFEWKGFKAIKGVPFLLAGGLQPENIEGAMQIVEADGYDVSSGVENSRGNKDVFLIQDFIMRVKK